jgi:hypothetical protein
MCVCNVQERVRERNERDRALSLCIQRLIIYRSIALSLSLPLSPSHLRFLALSLSHSLLVLVCQQPPVAAGSVTNKIHEEIGNLESGVVCQSCFYTRYQGKKSYFTRTGICTDYYRLQ